MDSRWYACLAAAGCLLVGGRQAGAADEATLLRVFLGDGTSLVSYGEPARVGDRVIFSMPTASTPNPPLHLVSLPANQVDWARTDRYAAAAREAHYVTNQADLDYAELSNRVSQALNELNKSTDAPRRLAIAESTRRVLAAWPQDHYNYRRADVQDMLSLLDEAIADLRAATGNGRFALSLSAFTEPPGVGEALLPPLTPKEAIEQVLLAARLVDAPAERTALLRTVLTGLNRDAAVLPPDWLSTTRASVQKRLADETLVDRAYRGLANRMMMVATEKAHGADVDGIERLIAGVRWRDHQWGNQRPETVSALLAAIDLQLDAARRLRLARDRWEARAVAFRSYRVAMQTPLVRLAALIRPLERIESLAGSSPSSLDSLERGVADTVRQLGTVTPPPELVSAHALLVSALHLAANAASIRREAALADNIARAWDASSAAAGALMLAARAQSDIGALLRPPQLR